MLSYWGSLCAPGSAELRLFALNFTKHVFLWEAVQLPEMGQIRALIGTMHCGVPTPMLAFPAPGFAAFVATLRMNFVAVPARCAFIAQTFANEKSGSTTRRNVEEFDDDSDDDSWQNF